MTDIERKYWDLARFYKGYLPAKEELEANSYVILARNEVDALGSLTEDFEKINMSRFEHNESPFESPEEIFTDSNDNLAFVHSSTEALEELSPPQRPLETAEAVDSLTLPSQKCNESIESNKSTLHTSLNRPDIATVSFYLYKKCDVIPPPFKYTVATKKVNRCFYMCEKKNCYCGRPHTREGTWHVRLDRLHKLSISVSDNGVNRSVKAEEITPTAGYCLALGLRAIGVAKTVIPILCRFNQDCRNGTGCLYIHANVQRCPPALQTTAATPLKIWGAVANVEENLPEEDYEAFFQLLEEEGLQTVGDLQVLGVNAFEAFTGRIPTPWSSAFLALSLIRSFDHKYLLKNALITFPRVSLSISLPRQLQRIGDLLLMPRKELYQIDVPPHALDACDIIRDRFCIEDEYNIISLKKEPADSFFTKVTNIIVQHSMDEFQAHFSWRKHDRTRPLVTSVFTYVDVTACRCGEALDYLAKEEDSTVGVVLPPIEAAERIGVPPRSWCSCPRYWVIAVNYELSTPSGSRCSEQNAMGKLASIGVPTWAVREVFVHGKNSKKESNPLFPCGVCENMLQKVNKDIHNRYSEDAVLYMYDATKASKLVSLRFPEISHRDGNSFKQFVSQDLRSGVLPDA